MEYAANVEDGVPGMSVLGSVAVVATVAES